MPTLRCKTSPDTWALQRSWDIVGFLSDPTSYHGACELVERVETHFAWVFFAGALAYKLKKPMHRPGMDLTALPAREHACREELRLNRRLAAEVYLDVVPVTRTTAGGLALGGAGTVVEWLVKMKRLPAECMLDRAVLAGTVTPGWLEPVGILLGEFYRSRIPVITNGEVYERRLRQQLHDARTEFDPGSLGTDEAPVEDLIDRQIQFLERYPDLFGERARCGHVVEGHGDLRPEHICLANPTCIIDCLEFDRDLRVLDAAEELAFLCLECELLSASWVGQRILRSYRDATGDAPADGLLAFYRSRRAAVRAKLCAWRVDERGDGQGPVWMNQGRNYLRLAGEAIERAFRC